MFCRTSPESADTDAGTSCRRSERFSAVTMTSGNSPALAVFSCARGAFGAAQTPAIDKHIVLVTTLTRMTPPADENSCCRRRSKATVPVRSLYRLLHAISTSEFFWRMLQGRITWPFDGDWDWERLAGYEFFRFQTVLPPRVCLQGSRYRRRLRNGPRACGVLPARW